MTLPSNSTISAVEFNHFNTMSYNTTTSPLMDEIYYYRPSQQSPRHQQQQQRLTEALEQAAQRSQPPALSPSAQHHTHHHQQQAQLRSTNVATAAATVFSSLELGVENVMPGIYLTKNFIAWNEENLRSHGFTHIIIIDKHIQELYYPSPVFKLSTQTASSDIDAFDAFEYTCHPTSPPSLNFGKEFEAIDLNFGEKSYLTTVLPNCYRAVKFINKALQAGGSVLVIDCNGGEQKCLTIIVAYLMYKHNIDFSNAFARLRGFYKKADLDRFYMSQLYEYEPILQVQRAQSRGHSCSRELHSAILKRKKVDDDVTYVTDVDGCSGDAENGSNELFDTLNPLSHFKAAQQQPREQQQQQQQQHQHEPQQQPAARPQQLNTQQERQQQQPASQQQELPTAGYTNGFNAWDDYAME